MAGKKSQVRLAKLVAPVLPKGETPRAVAGVQTAIPVWGYVLLVIGALLAGVGLLLALAIVMVTRKKFVLVLTSTGVFVVRLTKRPFLVVATYPLGAVPISGVEHGLLWTRFQLQLPEQDVPIDLQADRLWRTDLGHIVAQAAPAPAASAASSS